ncbi:DUF1353 domain-containing protein [Mesobacterium pallidum]|uniref:DUF1353 domain-containing protein n=1 Tax=Mesobacterium pallidum TaxID=2872037 RepID=UPI001EE399A9|nr:DUF1353 domain-containing protein [Mesobacterium pallidum]
MTRLLLALPILSLAACTDAGLPATSPLADATRAFCQGVFDPVCRFFNAPVQLAPERIELAGRAYPFFPVSRPLTFVDARNYRWVAPEGTLTDGASIPPAFVSVVGQPTSPEFRAAAALHDAICGVGNEALPGFHSSTWEDAHRMFYEALRVGGTDERRAKVMFAAVYLGGPRWNAIRPPAPGAGIVSTQGRWMPPATRGTRGRAAGQVSDAVLREELRTVIRWIDSCGGTGEACYPTIPQIEAYAWSREQAAIDLNVTGTRSESEIVPPEPVEEPTKEPIEEEQREEDGTVEEDL